MNVNHQDDDKTATARACQKSLLIVMSVKVHNQSFLQKLVSKQFTLPPLKPIFQGSDQSM